MRKWKIIIRNYNHASLEVELTAILTTKVMSKDKAIELATKEAVKYPNSCWELK